MKEKREYVIDGPKYRAFKERGFLRIELKEHIPGLRDKPGDIGGLIENADNLSQEGRCWIGRSCYAIGNSRVEGNARLIGHIIVTGNAIIKDNALIEESCQVSGNAVIQGHTRLTGFVWVKGDSVIGNPNVKETCILRYKENSDSLWIKNFYGPHELCVHISALSRKSKALMQELGTEDNKRGAILTYAIIGSL